MIKLKQIYTLVLSIIMIGNLVFIPHTAVHAMEASSDTIYKGIDVSQWQGTIDFAKVKADGVQIVYIRSSSGTDFKDPYFESNYENAKKQNLKVGFYHYVKARTLADAKKEAEFFVSLIKGKDADCKPAMDFESFGKLSKKQINEIGEEFITTLVNLSGEEAVLYSNSSTARTIFDSRFSGYSLWIAEYGVTKPQSSPVWSKWAGFQYSSTGRVNGIKGNVDMDKFTDDMFSKSGAGNESDPNGSTGSNGNSSGNTNNSSNYKYIVVKKGDTLWSISRKYNTTVEAIVSLNKIKNSSVIHVGEKLKIEQNKQSSKPVNYTIQKGDTLSSIAKKYKTTVNALAKLNKIKNIHKIYIGEVLRLK